MLTRIIVYAHYLSDVTVGALFGFAGGMFFYLWASGRLGLKWIPHLSLDQSDADGRRSAVGQRYNHARRFTPMALKPEFEKLFADHAAGPKYFALATSSKAGVPNVVPIGFLWVENGEIRVVDNYLNKTLANIRENPIAAVYAMGGETGKECIQVKGKAVYEDSGPEFEAAYKRAKAKNEKYPAKGLVRIFPEHVYNTSPGPTAGDEIH